MSRSAGSQSSAHHIVAYVAALKDTHAWRERAGGVFWAETAPRGRNLGFGCDFGNGYGVLHLTELRVCVNMAGQTTHILLSGAGVWTVERLQCAQWRNNDLGRSGSPAPLARAAARLLVRIRIYGSRAPRGSDRLRRPFVRFRRCAFLCAFCGYFYLPIDGFACKM